MEKNLNFDINLPSFRESLINLVVRTTQSDEKQLYKNIQNSMQ